MMRWRMKTGRVETLGAWLDVATRGLSYASGQRVRDEIVAHVELAREDAMEHGANDEAAGRAAVESLGDARAANRRYRRVLLKVREESLLLTMQTVEAKRALFGDPFEGPTFRTMWRIGVVGVVLMMFAFALRPDRHTGAMVFMTLGALLLCRFPYYAWKPSRGWRWVYRVGTWGFFAACAWLTWGPDGVLPLGSMGTFVLVFGLTATLFVWQEIPRIALRRKLPIGEWPRGLYY